MIDLKRKEHFIVFILFIILELPHLYAGAPQWKFNTNDYEYSMQFVAVAEMDGMPLTNPDDLLAVFVGDECRGVTNPTPVKGGRQMAFYLNAMSNSSRDDLLSFKIYSSARDEVVDCSFHVKFKSNDLQGSISSPVLMCNSSSATHFAALVNDNLKMWRLNEGEGYQFVSTSTILEYSLYTICGTLVEGECVDSKQFILYSSGFHNGIYVLNIKTPFGEVAKKLVF